MVDNLQFFLGQGRCVFRWAVPNTKEYLESVTSFQVLVVLLYLYFCY